MPLGGYLVRTFALPPSVLIPGADNLIAIQTDETDDQNASDCWRIDLT